jgi:hypothetical protein
MLRFKYIHLYLNPAKTLDINSIAYEVARFFPYCQIDIRLPFLSSNNISDKIAENLASIRVPDIKRPFYDQLERGQKRPNIGDIIFERNLVMPTTSNENPNYRLYDGFMMQRLLEEMLSEKETPSDHVHIVFEDRLICTFGEDDWRYHARALICGTPSIISTTGIIEAPAKPKEWYLKKLFHQFSICETDTIEEEKEKTWKRKLAEKYIIDSKDYRINSVAVGYVLQALFFFLSNGNPFCNDNDCRLFNAHWQEDLMHSQIQTNELCKRHTLLLHEFNKK